MQSEVNWFFYPAEMKCNLYMLLVFLVLPSAILAKLLVNTTINIFTRAELKRHQNFDVQIVFSKNISRLTTLQRELFDQLYEDWPLLHFEENKSPVNMIINERSKCTISVVLLSLSTLKGFIKWVRLI